MCVIAVVVTVSYCAVVTVGSCVTSEIMLCLSGALPGVGVASSPWLVVLRIWKDELLVLGVVTYMRSLPFPVGSSPDSSQPPQLCLHLGFLIRKMQRSHHTSTAFSSICSQLNGASVTTTPARTAYSN